MRIRIKLVESFLLLISLALCLPAPSSQEGQPNGSIVFVVISALFFTTSRSIRHFMATGRSKFFDFSLVTIESCLFLVFSYLCYKINNMITVIT